MPELGPSDAGQGGDAAKGDENSQVRCIYCNHPIDRCGHGWTHLDGGHECKFQPPRLVATPRSALWPWEVPGRLGFFSIYGAYKLAYADPAEARATGKDGRMRYLMAAAVRAETMGIGRGTVHA